MAQIVGERLKSISKAELAVVMVGAVKEEKAEPAAETPAEGSAPAAAAPDAKKGDS